MMKLYAVVTYICLSVGCMQCIFAQKTDNVQIYKTNYKTSERKLYERTLRHINFFISNAILFLFIIPLFLQFMKYGITRTIYAI